MSTSFLRKTGAAASIALALSFGLAACGDDEETSSTPESPASSAADASAGTFGPACGEIPADGAGSFNGMATEPVATAASANPLLSTLVAAVGAAGLGDTLNNGEAWTVFAPVNTAFADIQDTVDTLLKPANKAALGKVLTHHVLAERVEAGSLQGEYDTVNMDKLTVSGNQTDGFTVTDGVATAKVICGGVMTDNATVYIIDTVLAGAKGL